MSLDIRPADPADGLFLAEMLVAAFFWRPDGPEGSVGEIFERPEIARYVVGWPRPGDLGVVAESGQPVGAAWLRLLPENDPGYGFVDAQTPELSMGVLRSWRGRGVGRALLEALIAIARDDGLDALSLSVEPDNYAQRLYERVGFREVGAVGGSRTMRLEL